jgi:hypothetical protein
VTLPGAKRYEYFVKKVTDWEVVWGLFSEGWATAADSEDTVLPFWPGFEFAALCAEGAWTGYAPKEIQLYDFLETWLPGMGKDGLKVAVFPVAAGQGVVVTPARLQQDLAEECAKYE